MDVLGASGLKNNLATMYQNKMAAKMLSVKQRADQIDLQNIKAIKDPRLQLRRVSQEMEAMMIKMMFKSMKKNIQKTGMIDGGFAEEIFDDMLVDEYAKKSAQTSSMGIADMIYNQYVDQVYSKNAKFV